MDLSWLELASIGIIAFFAQVGGCVVGGGGFIIQPALIAMGVPAQVAVANDISTSAMGNLSAGYVYARKGALRWHIVRAMAPGLFLGAFLGVLLLNLVSQRLIEQFLGIVSIIFLAQVVWVKRAKAQVDGEIVSSEKTPVSLRSTLLGLFLGAYTTFSGAGAGSLAVLFISKLFDLNFVTAIGVRWISLGSVGLIGFFNYYWLGLIRWQLLGVLLAVNLLAGFFASKIVLALGERWIRPIFLASIFVFSIYLILPR